MQVWNMLHTACWKCRTQKSRQKSPSGHLRITLSGYIFTTKACIDNRKKLVNQQYVLQMSPQYGELQRTSGWERFTSLGTPANFNDLRFLAELLHGCQVVRIRQTLRRWTEGTTYVCRATITFGIGPHSSCCCIVEQNQWISANTLPAAPLN